MTFLRHELVHRSDNKRGSFIPKDPAQNQFATNYALGMLSMSEKALRLNGRSLNDYSPKVNPNDKTVIADTKYFYSLDQRKSDDMDLVYFNKDKESKYYWSAVFQNEGIFNRRDTITFAGHGSHGHVHDERLNSNFKKDSAKISVEQLANDIRNTRKWKESNNGRDIACVHLYACYSASGTSANNDNSIAQKLANELKVPVIEYTGEYHYFPYLPLDSGPAENSEKKTFLPKKDIFLLRR